ncbi:MULTISPECIES: hypothetical protein [unclassified Moorena]|uniref:hypothetical protein n=1 Tax=unclassified Moorena TaxID=2683338 RepID=UPI0013CBC253|nr:MULTISPECIES: hypothetical protein [unclassified Moorena]NEO21930.1 hypothetical protein [Moorena sp. SIO4A5]NEQ56896.1 hypothetical protein [Moorena sp. SIO4A1]
MFLINKEATTQKIELLDKSQIIFQNKLFTKWFDIFPKAYQKAFKFCRSQISDEYSSLYLLVEHRHYLTIWIEQEEVSLANKVYSSPINSDQPKSTDSLPLMAAISKGENPRYFDGEQSRNPNQFPREVLPDSLPEDISASEASIVTENLGYWYNHTEYYSPATPKLATGNLNQEQEIPESEFHLHPRFQEITKQSLKRLSKK